MGNGARHLDGRRGFGSRARPTEWRLRRYQSRTTPGCSAGSAPNPHRQGGAQRGVSRFSGAKSCDRRLEPRKGVKKPVEGHLYQRGKTKAWYLLYDVPVAQGEKRRQRNVRIGRMPKAEAEARKREFLRRIDEGLESKPVPLSAEDYLTAWLESVRHSLAAEDIRTVRVASAQARDPSYRRDSDRPYYFRSHRGDLRWASFERPFAAHLLACPPRASYGFCRRGAEEEAQRERRRPVEGSSR